MGIIDDVCEYASEYFNIEKKRLFSRVRDGKTSMVKFIVWELLHHELNISISKLARAFYRDERTVKLGVSKMKTWMAFDRYYRETYKGFSDMVSVKRKEGSH